MGVKKLEHNGRSMTLRQWSIETGLPIGTIQDRIKGGWDTARALTTPSNSVANRSQGQGRTMRTGVLTSLLNVWDRVGKDEFERQLETKFKQDAVKTILAFQAMLPKEVEQGETPKTAIQVNNYIDPSDFNSRFSPMGGQ